METDSKLRTWMKEQGLNNRMLGERLGFDQSYIYMMAVTQTKPLSDTFKYRFILNFGYEEASKVFEVSPNFQTPEIA